MSSRKQDMQRKLQEKLKAKEKDNKSKTEATSTATDAKGSAKSSATPSAAASAATKPPVKTAQQILNDKRFELARKARAHVKKVLPLGASNAKEGFSVVAKFYNVITDDPKSPFFESKYPAGKNVVEKKRILETSLSKLSEMVKERDLELLAKFRKTHNESDALELVKKQDALLNLSPAEKKQLKAVIANLLMYIFFQKENLATLNTIEDLFKQVQILRLFKVGNCGDQVKEAVAYLFQNYYNEPALYPVRIFEARKPNPIAPLDGSADPENGHQVLLLGPYVEEVASSAKDIDQVVCDTWQDVDFLFSKWENHAPTGIRRFDVENSFTCFAHKDPKKVERQVKKALETPALSLGVTEEEVNRWIETFYNTLTHRPHLVDEKSKKEISKIAANTNAAAGSGAAVAAVTTVADASKAAAPAHTDTAAAAASAKAPALSPPTAAATYLPYKQALQNAAAATPNANSDANPIAAAPAAAAPQL